YSAAKAAEAQLAKVLALEGAPHGIRSNIINPDAVFQDSKLWSEEIRRERAAAQGIGVDQIEDFYRKRNLLGARILPDDVAQAALFFASDRSAKTTGCTLTVDGGVKDAFARWASASAPRSRPSRPPSTSSWCAAWRPSASPPCGRATTSPSTAPPTSRSRCWPPTCR